MESLKKALELRKGIDGTRGIPDGSGPGKDKVGKGKKAFSTNKKESSNMVRVRTINKGDKVKFPGDKGEWVYKGDRGGDKRFERIRKIGPANDNKNHKILRDGMAKVELVPKEK